MKDRLFILLQYLAPQHLLSRLAGKIAGARVPWIKNTLTNWFIRQYDIRMAEAAEPNPLAYASFNDFFTRALRDDVRPVCAEANAIACPADGSISQIGEISDGRIVQAKNHDYSVLELVGGDDELASRFDGGSFAVVYLSPRDYHRVHAPLGGRLEQTVHVPGDLFSVNNTTAENVPRLFARNERLVTVFDTDAGSMAVVLVGAMIVASIETVWSGAVTPDPGYIQTMRFGRANAPTLAKGDELGRFKLGSTVVLLFGPGAAEWQGDLAAGTGVRMGEPLGTVRGEVAEQDKPEAEETYE